MIHPSLPGIHALQLAYKRHFGVSAAVSCGAVCDEKQKANDVVLLVLDS